MLFVNGSRRREISTCSAAITEASGSKAVLNALEPRILPLTLSRLLQYPRGASHTSRHNQLSKALSFSLIKRFFLVEIWQIILLAIQFLHEGIFQTQVQCKFRYFIVFSAG